MIQIHTPSPFVLIAKEMKPKLSQQTIYYYVHQLKLIIILIAFLRNLIYFCNK